MTFTRVNPLGWALFEVLTSSQMNTLDIDHSNSVDGGAGGVYASSAAVDLDHFAGRIRSGEVLESEGSISLTDQGGLGFPTQSIQQGGELRVLGSAPNPGRIVLAQFGKLHVVDGSDLNYVPFGSPPILAEFVDAAGAVTTETIDITQELLAPKYITTAGATAAQPGTDFIFGVQNGPRIYRNWEAQSTAVGNNVLFPITRLIPGATLQEVALDITPPGGHGGGLPGALGIVNLGRLDPGTGMNFIATATDTEPAGTYETRHEIAMTAIGEVIDQTQDDASYYLLYEAETGANSFTGTDIWRIRLQYDLTQLRLGAG